MWGRSSACPVWVAALVAVLLAGTGCTTTGQRLPTSGSERPGDSAASPEPSPTRAERPPESGREPVDRGRPDGVPAGAQRARVTGHTDGDTLRMTGTGRGAALARGAETRVRLLQIDTPESVAPGAPEECFAIAAARRLRRLLPTGSTAWVVPDVELLDPYDRTLLYVWNERGRFVNLAMVRGGHARAVLYEPNDRHIDRMRAAEAQARAAGRGVWTECAYFGAPPGFVQAPGADPRFATCGEAVEAGFGGYVQGRDEEYAWYSDVDADGRVCER